jgi:hypothetical protein
MNILLHNLKFKFDYKQNIILFEIRFVEVDLKYNTLDVLIFLILLLGKFRTPFLK